MNANIINVRLFLIHRAQGLNSYNQSQIIGVKKV